MELNPLTLCIIASALISAILACVQPELGFVALLFLIPFLVSAALVARALERLARGLRHV